MSEPIEIYRAPSQDDAEYMRQFLAESGIEAALSLVAGPEGEEAVLTVQPEAEEEAVRVLSEELERRGLKPDEGEALLTGGAVCPNCTEPVPAAAGEPCRECGYAVFPAPEQAYKTVGRLFPDAKTCCADCCSPSTLASGACGDCGGPLEPVEKGAPACPAGIHMLVKGEAPGFVCPGCRAAYLE